MSRKAVKPLTKTEQDTLKRLELFARANKLGLFNVRGSLNDRARTITRLNGACPCHTKTRPLCPCKEVIKECAEKGECDCRVFLRPK